MHLQKTYIIYSCLIFLKPINNLTGLQTQIEYVFKRRLTYALDPEYTKIIDLNKQ